MRRFASFAQLLHEHFPKNYIVFISENSAEHNCYAVSFCFNIKCFFIAIIYYRLTLTFFSLLLEYLHTFNVNFYAQYKWFYLEIKIFLKDRSKAMPLQQSNTLSNLLPIIWDFFQINKNGHIVTIFRINYQVTIFTL